MTTEQTSLTLKTVRDSDIRKALANLNAVNGKTYLVPNANPIGHLRWADIKGDGRNICSVWVIVNENGGVSRSHLNGATMRKTLCAIEVETAFARDRANKKAQP